MNERQAQSVVLVRTVEETDVEGRLLPLAVRHGATRNAADASKESGPTAIADLVVRRAIPLTEALEQTVPALGGFLRATRAGNGLWPIAVAVGVAAGLATNALGPDRRINLLALPMLGLLGWNLLVYAAAVAARLVGHRGSLGNAWARLAGLVSGGWLGRKARRASESGSARRRTATLVAGSLGRFVARWQSVTADLLAVRTRIALHAGSIGLITGAIAGMYLRGVAFEYRATWESTLLDATGVQALLGALLGPAASLLGIPVPDVAPLRGPDGSGDAATWIHLYALTGILIVVIPRFVLLLIAGRTSRKLASDVRLDLNDGYYLKLSGAARRDVRVVDILPYSYRPDPATAEKMKALLHDLFGARADLRPREPVEYGGDATPDSAGKADHIVVAFNLAQSPESEVHGAFLERTIARLSLGGGRLLVLVDGTSYLERAGSPDRIDERATAWDRVVAEAGLKAVRFEPGREPFDNLLASAAAAIWTAPGPLTD